MNRIFVAASVADRDWLHEALTGLPTAATAAAASILVASAELAGPLLEEAGDRPVVVIGDLSGELDARVAYQLRRGLPGEQVRALLRALVGKDGTAAPPAVRPPITVEEVQAAQRAFLLSRKIAAATDLTSTEALAIDGAIELLDADRGQCLFHDGDGSLWSQAKLDLGDDNRRAASGLAGFAVRTKAQVLAARAREDLRWVATVDDPRGDGSEGVVAQPVVSSTGFVQGVLVLVRLGRRSPFTTGELMALERYAALLSPFFDQLSAYSVEQSLLQSDRTEGLFRTEAMAAYAAPQRGQVIRLAPTWVSGAYWALAALLIAAALFVTVAKVNTYSIGAAVIRTTSKRELTARSSGNVVAMSVQPGDAVERGTVIAQLDDQSQRAALERIERDLGTELRNHMLDPGDQASDQAVRQLRQLRDAARAELEERLVRSPGPGIITDVRVRAGQRVEPGNIFASMVDGDGPLEVIALLPGSDRPQLSAGMAMRLELSGYRYLYQALQIDSVSADVIGPSEARRVLGAEVGESLQVGGPVVLVRGRLPRGSFTVDGTVYRFHDGMQGTATVSVRSERILFALIPGLRRM